MKIKAISLLKAFKRLKIFEKISAMQYNLLCKFLMETR